ncbi:MAG: UDP-N-acetylmuramate--L-alanine ligase [Bacillota bacterium]
MFEINLSSPKYRKVHFIGIGGISMSGLAEILIDKGISVSGTDTTDSDIVNHLRTLGAKIFIGHSKENIGDSDLIIYTDAISTDNEELLAAIASPAPVIDRAAFLGALMRNYKNSIAVSGTHGKTTTTSMIATIINNPNINPTILLGGELDDIGGNVKLGSDDYLLTEACEYKANILKYSPSIAIVLNIDEDHLDFFKSMDHISDTFKGFLLNLQKDDYAILNNDDPHVRKLLPKVNSNIITFGIDEAADYEAKNISFNDRGYPEYELYIKGEKSMTIKLSVMGIHNIYNSLAAIVATNIMDIDMEYIAEKIFTYTGVHRRLEHKGFLGNVEIIDDYAHHPTEIRASLGALRQATKNRIYCIFQPHTFTRTKILLESFSEAFKDADKIVIADIYAAREKDFGEIHSRELALRIKAKGFDAVYLGSFDEIESFILKETSDSDVVVTMGAGNIFKIGDNLLKKCFNKVI